MTVVVVNPRHPHSAINASVAQAVKHLETISFEVIGLSMPETAIFKPK
jgi:hypothetical protein